MANGYFKAQYETTPQNEVATSTLSTKTIFVPLISVSPKQGADHLLRDDELRGMDEPLPPIPESFDPSWEAETRLYPDSAGFFLKSAFGAPTTTAGNGVITDPGTTVIPAGAYRHVWTAPFYTGLVPQTMEGVFAYKDMGVFFKQKGMGTDSLSIEAPQKGGIRLKASGPATHMARIADPALSPAYESLAIRPFVHGGITLAWLGGGAATEEFTLNASAPVAMTHSLNVQSKYPDIVERGDDVITFSGTIKKRQLNVTDWDAFLAATGFAATVTYTSDSIIASGYPYKLFFQFSNVVLTSGDVDDLDNQGRRDGASYGWKATNAGAASVTVSLINSTASYA